MQTLPPPVHGTPDLRSPGRFLLRVAWLQRGALAGGVVFGSLWLASQAFLPFVVGRAVDEGLVAGRSAALLGWLGVLLALGVAGALAGLMRHRFAVAAWLLAFFRTARWNTGQAVALGASLPLRTSTGELVSVQTTDSVAVARLLDVTARAVGSLVAFVVVAVLLLSSSLTLGLVVVVGVPVLTLASLPLLPALHARQAEQRTETGVLTELGTDTVAGLRVLRGIGGEREFVERYTRQSQTVRRSGVRVARTQAWLDATQVAIPGVAVVAVTWLGARFAVQGRISVGELVAFYGYAAFLVSPIRQLVEAADKATRAWVAARRFCTVLGLQPVVADTGSAPLPAGPGRLVDPTSGVVAQAGVLTAVVAADPVAAAGLADRLGRFADAPPGAGPVTLDGTDLRTVPLARVRQEVLVADERPYVFSGRLADELDPTGRHDDAALLDALDAASALDIVQGLPDGLDAVLGERGLQLSGGQRQRLVLARALLVDPRVLLLVEPTSAVDAHTEARVADGLRAARAGRTTVVLTASPLVLDRAEEVLLVLDGRVVARGRHHELLDDDRYRDVVLRGVTA